MLSLIMVLCMLIHKAKLRNFQTNHQYLPVLTPRYQIMRVAFLGVFLHSEITFLGSCP